MYWTRNPIRPIISQIPTPTYHLAKTLNRILTPYVPSKYCLQSSSEFLEALRDTHPSERSSISSLDVESLFTNVPVEDTIQMIIQRVYHDDTTPDLNIPEDALAQLLRICTQKSPFTSFEGHLYTQVDGVAMGSPLGVLFANFYMGTIEERVFNNRQPPKMYKRYIDDIFIVSDNPEEAEELQQAFQDNSVLRFTIEKSNNNTLPFLDVSVSQDTQRFNTTVYTKPTNLGLCLNGNSECPPRYKTSVIDTYIRRALTHCSSWATTTEEIERVSQVLVNNGFSNREISTVVRKAIDKWYQEPPNQDKNQDKKQIKLFYRGFYHLDYKKDEAALRNIIDNNVHTTNDDTSINLCIYYKNMKTSQLLMRNNPAPRKEDLKQHGVIYSFSCQERGCPSSYIGMTTTTLSKRLSCHLLEGAIKQHFENAHNRKITRKEIVTSTEVIDRAQDVRRLRYLEALHIIKRKPSLNTTQEAKDLPTIREMQLVYHQQQRQQPLQQPNQEHQTDTHTPTTPANTRVLRPRRPRLPATPAEDQ